MAKSKSEEWFVCADCGHESTKWLGQCPSCSQWNTFSRVNIPRVATKTQVSTDSGGFAAGRSIPLAQVDVSSMPRYTSGSIEFDRSLGGGFLPGMFGLLTGDPGIGKSTIMLQVAAHLSKHVNVLYVCGEESPSQVRYRANRMGVGSANIHIFPDTHPKHILVEAERLKAQVVIIDSVQTLFDTDTSGLPGSITQVREAAVSLLRLSKDNGITVWMIGHVTKTGDLAGPRVLEHMVDTVLMLESGAGGSIRMIRTIKNRFGRTDELAFFQMTEKGMEDVSEGASVLVDLDSPMHAGSAFSMAYEGYRTWLVEVRALVVPTAYAMPKRSADGLDMARAQRLVAVAERMLNLPLATRDVYLNVTGGFQIKDPSMDLAICAAILSSYKDQPSPNKSVFIGEVGLAGEIRRTPYIEQRLNEAQRLGVERAWIGKPPRGSTLNVSMQTTQLDNLTGLVERKSKATPDLDQK